MPVAQSKEKQIGIYLLFQTTPVGGHLFTHVFYTPSSPYHYCHFLQMVHEGGEGEGGLKINLHSLVRHFKNLLLSQSDREVKDTAS